MAAEVSLASPIASQGKACAALFDQLCALFENGEQQLTYKISHLEVCDCYGQFKIWAGNIGALQTIQSTSSLDYRLREVPKVSKQVTSLLEDLGEVLEDISAIALGERENRVSSPVPFDVDVLSDQDKFGGFNVATDPSTFASPPTSEIQELFQSIPETIAGLFKLSILIRNSSSRDRYAKASAAASKLPFSEQFDIDHVGNKFPRLSQDGMIWLRTRLGKAITQRRQYLRYCRDHHEKLSKVPETTERILEPNNPIQLLALQGQKPHLIDDDQTMISKPTSILAPTIASTVVPDKLNNSNNLGRVEEEYEDDNRSQTSYAASVAEDDSNNRLCVIRLDDVAPAGQPFECPYCWTIQKISRQDAWQKHVMRDLRPYVCTSEICDMKLFPDRHTWFTHELQNHLVEWRCCFCSHSPYQALDKFKSHVHKNHADSFANDQLPALVKVCQQPLDRLLPTSCPFCDEWEGKLRELNQHMSADEILVVTPQQFRHHVGGHMEQLALFAIPRGYREDGDAGSSRAAPGHSEASSDRSLPMPDYENDDNPREHVSGIEGLEDEPYVSRTYQNLREEFSQQAPRSMLGSPKFSPFPKLQNPGENVPFSYDYREELLENARLPVLHSNDPDLQLKWAQDALSWVEVAINYANRCKDSSQPTRSVTPAVEHQLRVDAMNIVQFLADQHHPKAEFMKGTWLEFGKFGHRVDRREAFRSYARAAERGYARAEYRMGMQYENSNEPAKAIKHYQEGVALKDSASYYRLGMMTLLGQHGIPQDYQRGVDLIRLAADKADENAPQGAYVYGMLLARELSGINIPEHYLAYDINGAKLFIEKAAYLGFARAQLKMAQAYELCQLGCEFDPALSLHYNALAARQGEAEADMAISKWFLCGHEGVFEKNEELAFTYAQRAARASLDTAEFAMGYFYEVGVYVQKDLKESEMWYQKASDHGNKDALGRIEGIRKSNTLSRKDHEHVALSRIKSQYSSQRGRRPDRFEQKPPEDEAGQPEVFPQDGGLRRGQQLG